MPETQHYSVVFSGTLAGQFVQSVLHVKSEIATPVNSFASALLIAQDINDNGVQEAWMDMLPVDYLMTSLRVRRIDGTGGATAILIRGQLTQPDGQRAGAINSAQVNPVITWIGTTSPDKPGKTFVPGVSEDDLNEMVLLEAIVTAYQAFAEAWKDGGTLGGVDTWKGCIWRREAEVGDLIFAAQVSPLIGTQKKRLHPV